jgi:hypothetical protein
MGARAGMAARLVDDLPVLRFFPDALLALLGTALVASCDEWHQTFLPNRTGTPWDVLLDCCGHAALQRFHNCYTQVRYRRVAFSSGKSHLRDAGKGT